MNEFNLAKALAGDPVETREGTPVEIILLDDRLGKYCLAGVYCPSGVWILERWTEEGILYDDGEDYGEDPCSRDLVMAEKK